MRVSPCHALQGVPEGVRVAPSTLMIPIGYGHRPNDSNRLRSPPCAALQDLVPPFRGVARRTYRKTLRRALTGPV